MTERLAIFPLGAVLYPGLVLPLHVFEQRYRDLVRDLLTAPEADRRFGVVAIRSGREVGVGGVDGLGALHSVGCIASLREVEAHDDGRFSLVTAGTRRFRLGPLDTSRPYLQSDVELLDEPAGDAAVLVARGVSHLFGAYRAALTGSAGDLDVSDDPELLSYLVAAAAILDRSDKQALLEEPDTTSRLRHELALLRREAAVLRLLPSLPAVDLPFTATSPN